MESPTPLSRSGQLRLAWALGDAPETVIAVHLLERGLATAYVVGRPEGVAAGAVVDRRLVAIAITSARTARHADVGVATLAPWRRRGLATAAASLVTRAVQAAGQTPVWSCGEDNLASLRVARKLGFVEV